MPASRPTSAASIWEYVANEIRVSVPARTSLFEISIGIFNIKPWHFFVTPQQC
jgi:hypothetical protein